MAILKNEMIEMNRLYSQLVSTLTREEAKQLRPHIKATIMLMREMTSKHQLKRVNDKLDDVAMFITGEAKRIDKEE